MSPKNVDAVLKPSKPLNPPIVDTRFPCGVCLGLLKIPGGVASLKREDTDSAVVFTPDTGSSHRMRTKNINPLASV